MKDGGIRLLRAEEIECRVSTINERGLSVLLFKDARVDQKILDETFTPFGWKRSHQLIDGNLYCTVEVWDGEKKQWVGKQDVGTTSYSEKEKGQASDSFKRACFNWGIGRELYTAPFIWVPAGQADIQKKGRGEGEKFSTSDRFQVQSISYSGERSIVGLVIVNNRGQTVYAMGRTGPEQTGKGAEPAPGRTGRALGRASGRATEQDSGRTAEQDSRRRAGQEAKQGMGQDAGPKAKRGAGQAVKPETGQPARQETAGLYQMVTSLDRELQRTGVALEAVLERYQIRSVEEMTPAMYQDAMSGLKKSKDWEAA